MATQRQRIIDIEGTDVVSTVLLTLLNQFPGLDGREIMFSTLTETSGISMFPTSGAVVIENRENVLGEVHQVCAYPFDIIYRAALKTDKHKLRVKEFLDALGKWLERQPVTIMETEYHLTEYPDIGDKRKIDSIMRTTPAFLNAILPNGIEDWMFSGQLRYEVDYNKYSD